MSPAEYFFLAVGLLLGVAAGAAVLDVLRARPPRPEVHLTITREALPRRAGAPGGPEAARDPVAVDVPPTLAAPLMPGSAPKLGAPLPLSGPAAPVPPLTVRPARVATSRTGDRVAVAVGQGLDPTLAALRAVARERRPAMAARPSTGIRRPFAEATAAEHGPAASGEATIRVVASGARGSAGGDAVRGRMAASEDPPGGGGGGGGRSSSGGGSGGDRDSGGGGGATSRGPDCSAGTAGNSLPPAGPCAAERLLADGRCAVASQARERADEVANELRQAQRAYDTAAARAEAAAKTSDPRAVADAKEAARQQFRAASHAARARSDLEAAATEWLSEINRINHERREASEVAAEARQTAAQLLGTIERLTLAADASRITAAAAASACMEARQLLADCEERASQAPAAAVAEAQASAPTAAPPPPARAFVQASTGATALLEALQRPLEVPAEPGGEGGLPPAPSYRDDDHQPAIFRLLQGDRQTLVGVVDGLAGPDRDERPRTQQLLSEMVEAVVAGAIEACVLDFPTEHPFWGDFDRSQCRDIAVALASLGYRFDGLGGFVDERSPTQRDLSLAVGYAGLDPMRIRRWPNETEIGHLYAEVRVGADEYLADRAPDLTLGEMVTLLGRRSEPLAELWNAWGRARPLLLAAT